MKKINIVLVVLGIVLIAANGLLLNTLNQRLDGMSSKLDQLEVQLTGAQTTPQLLTGLLGLMPPGSLPALGQYLTLLDLISNIFV